MTRTELERTAVVELRRLAGEHGVVGASRLRKDALVAKLAAAMNLPSDGESAAPAGLAGSTVHQLRRLAIDHGVRGAARMNKDDLLAQLNPLLAGHDTASSAPVPVAEAPRPAEPIHKLPDSYGLDRVVLLVRDPDWLYAYWDISGDTWAALIQRGVTHPGKGWQRILRIHDVTGVIDGEGGTWVTDLEVGDVAREWYFRTPDPERAYVVEFGYRSPDGQWLLVARSNAVHVPRRQPSAQMDERWGTLYHEAYRLSLAGSDFSRQMGASEVTRRLQALLHEGVSSGHFGVPVSAANDS